MASLLRPFVVSHDVGMIDYRGKQLTLIGGPLLDPFSASFQGELMFLGDQVLLTALYNTAQLGAIAGSVSHGVSSVPVMQHLCAPHLRRTGEFVCILEKVCNRGRPTLRVLKEGSNYSQQQQSLEP